MSNYDTQFCRHCGMEITPNVNPLVCMGCVGKIVKTKDRPIVISMPTPPCAVSANYDKVVARERARAKKEKKLLIIEFGTDKGVEDYRKKQ